MDNRLYICRTTQILLSNEIDCSLTRWHKNILIVIGFNIFT